MDTTISRFHIETRPTRSNELPHDIRKALNTSNYNQSKWLLEEDKDAYVFLAKFAVAHHSHLEGLMPRMITKTSIWRETEIQKILEGAGPRPILTPLEPVKKEETKATRTPCRLKNAMGRGGVFTGKTGVTFVYPGQKSPTPAGTLPAFESLEEVAW